MRDLVENLGFEPTDSFIYTANGTLDTLDANQIVIWTNNFSNVTTPLKTIVESAVRLFYYSLLLSLLSHSLSSAVG